MRPSRISALVTFLLVLAASCASASEAPAPPPTTTSTTEAPLLFGARTNTTLVVAPGYGPLVALDLDTGNAQRFDDTGGVPGDFQYRLVSIESGVAYPGGDGVMRLPWTLEGPPASLGRAWVFVPAGMTDRLWLVDRPADGNSPYRLRQVDAAGDTSAAGATPPGSIPVGGVNSQIIVQQNGALALSDPLALTDPDADVVIRALGPAVLLATLTDRMAITEGCDTCAAVRVIDAGAPAEDVVAQTSGHATDAAFAPDGRWLAIWVLSDDGSTASLDLLDLSTGEVAPIRGSEAGPYADLVWSNDSSWVFAMSRGEVRPGTMITAYELGEPAAVVRTTPYMQSGTIVAIPDGEGPDLGSRPDRRTCPKEDGLDDNGNPLSAVTAGHPCRLPLSP